MYAEISGVPTPVYMGLLSVVLILAGLIMAFRLVPAPAPAPRPVQRIRHEVVFVGQPVRIETPPAWLGQRLMTGQILQTGDVARINGSNVGLLTRYAPGTRVALFVVAS